MSGSGHFPLLSQCIIAGCFTWINRHNIPHGSPAVRNGAAWLAFANFALRRRIEPREPYLTTLYHFGSLSAPLPNSGHTPPSPTSASNGFGMMTPCEFSILRVAVYMQRHPHLSVTTLLKAVLSRAKQMLGLWSLMMPGTDIRRPYLREC